jgi:N-carbamoylputrescine amidase
MIMNKPITIGIIQSKILNNTQSNLEKALNMAEEAAKKGAKIICLPELFLSPYFCQGPKDKKNFNLAENIPGPTTLLFSQLAKKYKVVILCSLFEKTKQNKYFNSLTVIGTKGEILGTYHKMHIPTLPVDYYSENYYFEKGDEGFKVFKTPYGTIGL